MHFHQLQLSIKNKLLFVRRLSFHTRDRYVNKNHIIVLHHTEQPLGKPSQHIFILGESNTKYFDCTCSNSI